ncbi:hypothetical protein RUM43_001962 [Polyplax serrata]|uniref:Uncharacterized protein n=1 Tax=Polyplax serrata TaxID=468196 RepID=A0AAN8P1P3_POLSC
MSNRQVNLPSVRENVGLMRPYHVYEGDDALITCVVSNVGENTVTWKKEDRERHSRRVLTAGDNRVTGDKRFSVLHDNGGDVWVLVIKNANATDSGIYVCEVNSDPIVRSFHKLNVLSRALQPPDNTSHVSFVDTDGPKFNAKNHNYTTCCITRNVTKGCLGFCNIQSILEGNTGQDPENCENDFPQIVRCMADHRNHVPCCIEEGVPDICQDVCRGEYTVITDNIKTHFSCSAYTEQTLACIVEGIELLPSTPKDVEVEPTTEDSLKVTWKLPLANAHTVTSYIVNVTTLRSFDEIEGDSYVTALERNRKDEEKAEKRPLERKQIEVPSSFLMAEVTKLKPFTMYEITVTAKNGHGTSLPSFSIRSTTLPQGKRRGNMTAEPPQLPDIRACCVEKGVTHMVCLDKLCDPMPSDIAAVTDLMICAPWAATTFSCLTNGIDLSPCCKARGLPDACLVLCTGNVTQIDFSYFKCLKYMNDFSSCLFQSYGVLPGEPVGLSISNVNSDFAIIHWEPPKTLADTVLYYNLHYRLLATYDNDYKAVPKVYSPYVLEKLESNAEYEVYVEAVNVHGVSNPSSRILFRTKSKLVESRIEESSFYNVTECCISSGLADVCLPLCSYDASMVDIKNLAGVCGSEFHKLVKCGAGGRNHEKCCTRRGVPTGCLSLCAGAMVDSLLATATTCIPYIGNIVQCFEEGTGLLPGPISELHATEVTNSSISISWEPPEHSNVTDYLVFYDKADTALVSMGVKMKMSKNLNTTKTAVVLKGLETHQTYKIYVISRNNHGTSLPSSILLINVTETDLTNGGIKGIPSAPHSLAVSSHSANWVTISWHPPEFSHFSDAVVYKLYHKQASESEFHMVETSLTSHMLEGLTPNTQYIAYIIAATKSGSSLPSETLIVWTDPAFPAFVEPPTVHPINLVIEGSSMTILCIAMGTPVPTISLYISGRLVRQETTRHMVTVIHNVTKDMDQISCYADNGYGTPMQASRKITISHIPHIVASGITIASQGETVLLQCQVDAHPEPKMLFWRDHSGRVPVIQGGRHSIRITKNENEEDKWTMGLTIQSITEADEGDYFCHAENAFGSATQAVSVRIRKEASSGNVTQCCLDQKISPTCMDACSFFVDLDVVIDKPECLGEFDKLMKCAADGSDHRSCCGQRGVPRRCLDWCRGEPLFNNKICVLGYTKQIMSCFQEGREKLPGPPLNVRMEPIDGHSVFIKWDPPIKNPHTVVMYRVFWRQVGSRVPLKNDTKETRLKITGLKEGVTYECVVKAGNHIGTSTLTEPIKFTTGDKYVTSSSSIDTKSSSAGVIVGIVLAILIVGAIFTGALWMLKVKKMWRSKSPGGVAFENPSYLREANMDRSQGVANTTGETLQVTHLNGISHTVAPEGASVTPHQGWKPECLNVQQSTEVAPSLYEELKLGQDGVGFKRLKP